MPLMAGSSAAETAPERGWWDHRDSSNRSERRAAKRERMMLTRAHERSGRRPQVGEPCSPLLSPRFGNKTYRVRGH